MKIHSSLKENITKLKEKSTGLLRPFRILVRIDVRLGMSYYQGAYLIIGNFYIHVYVYKELAHRPMDGILECFSSGGEGATCYMYMYVFGN